MFQLVLCHSISTDRKTRISAVKGANYEPPRPVMRASCHPVPRPTNEGAFGLKQSHRNAADSPLHTHITFQLAPRRLKLFKLPFLARSPSRHEDALSLLTVAPLCPPTAAAQPASPCSLEGANHADIYLAVHAPYHVMYINRLLMTRHRPFGSTAFSTASLVEETCCSSESHNTRQLNGDTTTDNQTQITTTLQQTVTRRPLTSDLRCSLAASDEYTHTPTALIMSCKAVSRLRLPSQAASSVENTLCCAQEVDDRERFV